MDYENNDDKHIGKNKKTTNGCLTKDDNEYNLKAKNGLYEEESSHLNVNEFFDDIFTEISKKDIKSDNIPSNSANNLTKVGENDFEKDINRSNSEYSNNVKNTIDLNSKVPNDQIESSNVERFKEQLEYSLENQNDMKNHTLVDNFMQEKDFKSNYEKKLKELEEKIEEYNEKYHKLENEIDEYEDKNSELIKKRKEYEESIKEYEEKSKSLEVKNEDIMDQSRKLKEAREQFMELSKQTEEKKIDLEKRDESLKKLQKTLEKIKFELEKNKIKFETEKLEFKIIKSNLETKVEESNIDKYIKKEEEIDVEVEEGKIGKGGILQNLMKKLSQMGNFKSCFLIDGKGMLISEYSNVKLDTVAIGAMFSLICTATLRAVKSLNLHELEYFKISSINGQFILKSINIMNYERNFILLVYFDESNLTIPSTKQTINRKVIKSILKSTERDFYEFGNWNNTSMIFDNLSDKINFLKKKYEMPQKDIDLMRINLLNKISIKIKDLFEK